MKQNGNIQKDFEQTSFSFSSLSVDLRVELVLQLLQLAPLLEAAHAEERSRRPEGDLDHVGSQEVNQLGGLDFIVQSGGEKRHKRVETLAIDGEIGPVKQEERGQREEQFSMRKGR